ncbi:HepT-like ribonuclease domain-containing protein [Runella slithyformis]|uniref:HepT-like ribonuclease domain-containing protein n=1 Tax=Runella slithyformis TaxID=106 RepID=UPI0009D9BEF1
MPCGLGFSKWHKTRLLCRNHERIGRCLAAPHIMGHGIISFRNRLIHGYFGVDYQILWYLLQNELPQLKIDLQTIS